MNIIEQVLNRKEIQDNPPVLIDIGASGQIHKIWSKIAKHSICIAFDADNREFGFVTKEKSGYKKLHVFNCIVSNHNSEETAFYLTKSPYCSSSLEPDNTALSAWAFADKFEVEKKINLKSISLKQALDKAGLEQVDWFKTDSQGTDLRLFQSLGEDLINKVMVAEMEPGIIDSYKGEDKLPDVLSYMNQKGFWLSEMVVKGSQRISHASLKTISGSYIKQSLVKFSLKKSPGWTELLFFKTININCSLRDFFLSWVFATIQNQHGFAFEYAISVSLNFSDPLIADLINHSKKSLQRNYFNLNLLSTVKEKIYKTLKVE